MDPVTILSLVPAKGQLFSYLLREGTRLGLPFARRLAHDPEGTLSRIGDAVVWNSGHGQQVIAGLAGLSDGQSRIERAVNQIDSLQLGISHTLGTMHTLSMVTLGVTSLTGVYMAWRLESLNKRFQKLSGEIKDLDDKLEAQQK